MDLALVDLATSAAHWVSPNRDDGDRKEVPTHSQGIDPRLWSVSEPAQVRRFFAEQGKHVVYFAGYGELGYEDQAVVERVVEDVLNDWPRSQILRTVERCSGSAGKPVSPWPTRSPSGSAFRPPVSTRPSPCDFTRLIASQPFATRPSS